MSSSEEPASLERLLGYFFRERQWLEAALRHRSASLSPEESTSLPPSPQLEIHNERLEFLGDAVLELTLRELLFRRFPKAAEGELSQRRSVLASRSTLAQIARSLHLDRHLIAQLPASAEAAQERLLADALEAVLGAVYCDGGFSTACGVARRLLAPHVERLSLQDRIPDPKSALQEWWQQRAKEPPRYEVVRQEGPPHAPRFAVAVYLGDLEAAIGVGPSKRIASQQAAQLALERINGQPIDSSAQEGPLGPGRHGEIVYLGLGSNQGDRLGYLQAAVAALRQSNCRLLRVSSVYETEPVGPHVQGWFLNAVAAVETDQSPEELYAWIKATERRLGRTDPTVRWGPREIDIDLLMWGDRVIQTPWLTVPHQRMTERRFVLVPFGEIGGRQIHPLSGRTVAALRDVCPDRSAVRFRYPPSALISRGVVH